MQKQRKKKKNGTQIDVDMSSKSEKISNAINIVMFKERLPIWGGNFINNFGMNSHVKISNTCTIDNFLLALWTCTKLNNNIVSYISNMKFHSGHFLNEIITCIENKEWNKAKSIWLLDVLSLDYELECNCDHCKNCLTNGAISTFGSEYEFFLQPIVEIQKYEVLDTYEETPGHCRSIFYLKSIFFLIDDLNLKWKQNNQSKKL